MKPSLPHYAYDSLADRYAAMIDTKPHNAYYERPATRSLVGAVSGQRVLDAGCGPGLQAQWLLDQGAHVVGVDANAKMLSHARQRTAGRAAFHLGNLEEPLSYLKDCSFDGVVCSLAITYVREHGRLFREFRRVLRNGGWLVLSTEHPFFTYRYYKLQNYFETAVVESTWTGFGGAVQVPSHHHSLGSICNWLAESGFVIERILEPLPTDDFRASDPDGYRSLMAFPMFICIRAKADRASQR